MPSLILTNVHTKEGPKTFTMRWKKENNELISWPLIYAFIFKKTGIEKKYYKLKGINKTIHFRKINTYQPFMFNDYAMKNVDGDNTNVALIRAELDWHSIMKLRDNSGCIHLW